MSANLQKLIGFGVSKKNKPGIHFCAFKFQPGIVVQMVTAIACNFFWFFFLCIWKSGLFWVKWLINVHNRGLFSISPMIFQKKKWWTTKIKKNFVLLKMVIISSNINFHHSFFIIILFQVRRSYCSDFECNGHELGKGWSRLLLVFWGRTRKDEAYRRDMVACSNSHRWGILFHSEKYVTH